MYRPTDRSLQMNTPATYYACSTERVNGREQKVYAPVGIIVKGHFKERGGNEVNINGLKFVNKQITFTCWYDPRVQAKGRFQIYNRVYEITNVENVEMRNRYMICELDFVGAGA